MFDGIDDYLEFDNISLLNEVTWGVLLMNHLSLSSGNTNHIIGKFLHSTVEFVLELDNGRSR